MNYFQALILSLIEGITEFLPISSTGHLILTTKLLNLPSTDFIKSFEIFIQLGAILAVMYVYKDVIIKNTKVWKPVLIAFLPAAGIGFIFFKLIKQFLLGNSVITLISLIVGGVLFIILELLYKEKEHHIEKIENITPTQSILIGITQSLAIIPGVSRSGATILGGMFVGIKRKTAVEFSFLLAIPTMLAATALDLVKENFSFTSFEYSLLAVGCIGSFIFALLSIRWLLSYVQKNNFIPFGIYRIVVAILFWIFILRG